MLLSLIITTFIANLLIVGCSGYILDYVLKNPSNSDTEKMINDIISSFCVGISVINVFLLSLAWYYASKIPKV